MSTKRQLILEALKGRVEAIQVVDGFATDAGLSVLLGERPMLGPDDPETAIAILVFNSVVKAQGHKLFIGLPIGLAAIAKADLDAPSVAIEAILGDIKRAVELEDTTLGGLLLRSFERGPERTMDRAETGTTTVGVMVMYDLSYCETWGKP
jgi:hypothetical protein